MLVYQRYDQKAKTKLTQYNMICSNNNNNNDIVNEFFFVR